MSYQIKEFTIRTDNTNEGRTQVAEVWRDIEAGNIPLLFDSQHEFIRGLSPISKYSSYENEDQGQYDLTIMAVKSEFFEELEKMVQEKKFRKYDISEAQGDEEGCARRAWGLVAEEQKAGIIRRSYEVDYESTVPKQYTKDGKAHCYLYIGVCQSMPLKYSES